MIGNLNKLKVTFILLLCTLGMLIPGEKILAQNPVIEEIVEELASRSENEEQDYSSIIEDLNYLIENPLNLNNSNIELLENLHFLTEFQIENLLNYIASKGEMKSIYELQLIDGFDIGTIKKMLPFVMVAELKKEESMQLKQIINYGNNKIAAETKFVLQEQKGYIAEKTQDTLQNALNNYHGNRMKYLLRYRYNYKNKIFAGITTEKDPGETLEFTESNKGFDYYSFHFQINNVGIIKNLAVGDYQINFGQGLILSNGFSLGKSPDALNIRKKGQILRYYTSTDENNFMRGAATTIKLGKFELTTFFSRKKIDANLDSIVTVQNNDEIISNLQNTGYHRTDSEIENEKTVQESIIGSRLGISFQHFKAALNMVGYHYSNEIDKSDKPYKLFEFSGSTNINASIDYAVFIKKLNIFGEAAIGKNGSIAILNGLITNIVPQLSFSLLQRYYQRDYHAYYAASFSENSKITNENGLYYGLVYYPVRKLKISAYADLFQFPWLKYGIDAPSEGNEYLIQANFTINRNVDMYFRWRNQNKSGNLSIPTNILNQTITENRQNFRYHITYRISSQLSLRNRIEFVNYKKDRVNEYGFMIFQDINIDFDRIPLSVDIRFSAFDATYNARIYAYENDLLYNFSIPAYSGKGSRSYILIKYRIAKLLDLRLRYSQFLYYDREIIGSGLDEIDGNLKSEFKLQFILHI